VARNSKVQKKKPKPIDSKARARRGRPKVCMFCAERVEWVDYKDLSVLRRFVNDRGRIKTRGATGACAQHQRDVAVAIKTARELVLLPYVIRTQSPDKGERRGPRGPRPSESSSAPAADDATGDAPDEATGAEGTTELEAGSDTELESEETAASDPV
jgi:small subunit ribosomal protein S18